MTTSASDLATKIGELEELAPLERVGRLYVFRGWQAALVAMARLVKSGMTLEEASFFCSDVAALWVQGEDTLLTLDPSGPIH